MNADHLVYCASEDWRQRIEEQILPEALRGVTLGDDVIEIGPGPGFTTNVLMTKTGHLTAVEIDPDLAAGLETRLAASNVQVLCGDASKLDFEDDRFTGAASFHMLHHIEPAETQDKVLAELARVLRSGGVLVAADGIANEASRQFHKDDTYNPIEPEDLRRRLSTAGFVSIDIRVFDVGWVCTAVTA
jgi:SAM-dependent methyltransferase